MPLEPAGRWLRLPALTRALGAELFRLWQDRVLEGLTLGEAEGVIVRALGPDKRERKALRSAARDLVDAGLLVAVEGGIQLLYTAESYAAHGRDVGRMEDASGTHQVRKGYVRGTDGGQTGGAKSAESLDRSSQIEDRRERESAPPRIREAEAPPERLISVLLEELGSEAFERDLQPAPSAPPGQLRTAAERVQQLVQAGRFPEPRGAARALVRAALDLVRDQKRPFGLALLDATVAAPPPPVTEADLRPKRPSWWQEESA
jgi:hypothetical protein